MTREKAYRILGFCEYQNINKEERETLILNAWGIEAEDEEFYLLDKRLQEEMAIYDEPQHDIMNGRYDNLVLLQLEGYTSFRNADLEKELYKYTNQKFQVCGEEPHYYRCPCCGKETLTTRAEYDICGNCFWEDDGSEDGNRYSGVNHMTLNEGRVKYRLAKENNG